MRATIYFLLSIFIIFNQISAVPTIVTNTANAGVGSLRDAINRVNANLNDAIHFNIPPNDGLVKTITPLTNLPVIIRPVTIDGYTQPQATANTLPDGDNANILIEIRGGGMAATAVNNGLRIAGGSSIIRGLAINNFLGTGSSVSATAILLVSPNNQVNGNFLGTSADGLSVFPNQTGVLIANAGSNRVGTPALADRNVIAGSMQGSSAILTQNSSLNIIQNNFLGTDKTGRASLNNNSGVFIFQLSGFNTVGGLAPFERNVIRGSLTGILDFLDVFGNNVIQGNYIGVDVTGSTALADNGNGIIMYAGAHDSLVEGNVISGNVNGIVLGSDNADFFPLPDLVFDNRIINNIIGLDFTGLNSIPNTRSGIKLCVAQTNTIGDTPSERNVISKNGLNGVYLTEKCNTNTISNNYIGTDRTGTQARGNTQNGIQLGTNPAQLDLSDNFNSLVQNNVISANQANGILIQSGSTANTVQFNKIGVDWNAQNPLGNGKAGISVLCSDNNNL